MNYQLSLPKTMKLCLTSAEHGSNLLKSFNSFFENDRYSDLIFVCSKNTIVKAHKMVLASVSLFVRNLIATSLKSGQDAVIISIPDVEQRQMILLLKFLYEGVIHVNTEELVGLKDVLVLLGIMLPNTDVTAINSPAPGYGHSVQYRNEKKENLLTKPVKLESWHQPSMFPNYYHTQKSKLHHETPSNQNQAQSKDASFSSHPCPEGVHVKEEKLDGKNCIPESINYLTTEKGKILENKAHPFKITIKKEWETMELGSTQTAILEKEYQRNKYPETMVIHHLAKKFRVTPTVIDDWFARRRVKDRQAAAASKGAKQNVKKEDSQFTKAQLIVLENTYKSEKRPDITTHERLSRELGLPMLTVRNWFIRRRINERKDEIFGTNDIAKDTKPDIKTPIKMEPKTEGFTDSQVATLEQEYERSKHPERSIREKLSSDFGVRKKAVDNWFSYKRSKDKINSVVFTELQTSVLEIEYKHCKNPDSPSRERIAQQVGLSADIVKSWFTRRRSKERSRSMRLKQRKAFLFSRPRRKSKNFVFSDWHISVLEEEYRKNKFPDTGVQELLADFLKAPCTAIKNWFQKKQADEEKDGDFQEQGDEGSNDMEEDIASPEEQPPEETNVKMEIENKIGESNIEENNTGENEGEETKTEENEDPKMKKRKAHKLDGKRIRDLTSQEREFLEEEYRRNNHPDLKRVKELTEQLNLSKRLLLRWYCRRRLSEKRKNMIDLPMSGENHRLADMPLEHLQDISMEEGENIIAPLAANIEDPLETDMHPSEANNHCMDPLGVSIVDQPAAEDTKIYPLGNCNINHLEDITDKTEEQEENIDKMFEEENLTDSITRACETIDDSLITHNYNNADMPPESLHEGVTRSLEDHSIDPLMPQEESVVPDLLESEQQRESAAPAVEEEESVMNTQSPDQQQEKGALSPDDAENMRGLLVTEQGDSIADLLLAEQGVVIDPLVEDAGRTREHPEHPSDSFMIEQILSNL